MNLSPFQVAAVAAPETLLQSKILSSLAFHAARGERIGVIVGNNRLDVRALARLAQRQGLDPRPVLARIELSRAETCHQLHQTIQELPATKSSEWSALYLVGFMDNFYDETPAYREAEGLLVKTLKLLQTIASNGLPVLVLCSAPPRAGRERFLQLVAARVDVYREFAQAIPCLAPPRQLALEMGDA